MEDGTRRRRIGTALAVAGGLLLAGAAGHVGLGAYGARLAVGDLTVATPGQARELVLPEGELLQVQYLDRQEVEVRVPLRNTGQLPTTVTGLVPTGTLPRRLMHARGVEEPVRLGPGDRGSVVIRLLFTDCEFIGSRSSTVLDTLTLRYRSLWRVGTVKVPLRPMLRATSPRDSACPRSTVETRPPG